MKKLVLVYMVLGLSGGTVGAPLAAQEQAGVYIADADRLTLDQLVKFAAGIEALNQKDWKAAFMLWSPLAENGYSDAQAGLGSLYAEGRGVPQDFAAAAGWYRKAADQGNALAQFNLGVWYDKGQGVPQNYATAAGWYLKSADQGNAMSQFMIGADFVLGQGVKQDLVQAHKWLNLAAAGTSDPEIMKIAVTNRDAVAAKMTPARIAEAQKLASEWRKK